MMLLNQKNNVLINWEQLQERMEVYHVVPLQILIEV